MEWIAWFIRQVSVIAVLAAFLEMLLPNGEMQKFVRFFMGLLIVAAFLNPFMQEPPSHLFTVGGGRTATWEQSAGRFGTEEIFRAGVSMSRTISEKAEAQVQAEYTKGILALVRLVSGVEQAGAELSGITENGGIAGVRLTLTVSSGAERERLKQEIADVLTAFYALPKENITYVIKEAVANDRK